MILRQGPQGPGQLAVLSLPVLSPLVGVDQQNLITVQQNV